MVTKIKRCFKYIRSKRGTITMRVILNMLDYEELEMDRKLKPGRVRWLKDQFERGMVRPFKWRIAYIKGEPKVFYRMDGQHSTYVIEHYWGEWEKSIEEDNWQYEIEIYECETKEDLPKLFSTFNNAKSSRNANEIYDAVVATIPELRVIERKNAIHTAIRGAAYSKGYMLKSPVEKAEFIRDYVEYVLFLDELFVKYTQVKSLNVRPKNIFANTGVARAVFETFRKDPRAAREFWVAVAYNNGKHILTATKKLHEFLVSAVVIQDLNLRNSPDRKTIDSYPIACVCVDAWNKWQEGIVVQKLCSRDEVAKLWTNKKQELDKSYVFYSPKKRGLNLQKRIKSHEKIVKRFSLV